MRIAVVGCGPSGLAAAHAATHCGASVEIFAPKKQTPQRGPITLHRAIPGINADKPEGYVRQMVIGGSILDYRLKLYGDVNIAINGDVLEHGFPTWRVPVTYEMLWDRYEADIRDGELSPGDLRQMTFNKRHDLIILTAPLPNLCLEPRHHSFSFKEIAVVESASYPNQPDNTVIYNAYPDIKWVRSSRIFEAETTEWEPEDAPEGSLIIRKPLATTCDCHPGVFRTGRFGKWHNETWIDHAYFDTYNVLSSMIHKREWDDVR